VGRPTIKDVAVAAGLSTATVSLVLRDSSQIPVSTKKRVRDAMEAVGYVYNRRAAEMRSMSSKILGLVVTNVRNPYFGELTMAVEEAAHDAGYNLILGCSNDAVDRQAEILQAMAEHRVDGIILLPASHSSPKDLERSLDRSGLPHVLVARAVAGYVSDYVGADNEASGVVVGRHLTDLGVQSVAFLGGVEHSVPREDRLRGLMAGLGPSITSLTADVSSPYDATAGMASLLDAALEQGPPADAIVAYNDMYAFGIMSALRSRGIEPGRDVAVASFDNVPESAQHFPGLSSAEGFPVRAGELATELLLKAIQVGVSERQRIFIEPRLHVRDSTLGWRPNRRKSARKRRPRT
jgi:LacI family transcriptional regulator